MAPDDFEHEVTASGGRYFTTMPNGEDSRLVYTRAGDGHVVAASTFVPVPYRGDGIGEALVIRLFADARANGWKITPACWFVRDEFDRLAPAWDDVRA